MVKKSKRDLFLLQVSIAIICICTGDYTSSFSPDMSWPGLILCLKCPDFGLFSYWHAIYSSHTLYVHVFALLWPFSVDPTFLNATIDQLSTMPAQTTFQSLPSVSTKTKPKPRHFRPFRNPSQDMSGENRVYSHPKLLYIREKKLFVQSLFSMEPHAELLQKTQRQ